MNALVVIASGANNIVNGAPGIVPMHVYCGLQLGGCAEWC